MTYPSMGNLVTFRHEFPSNFGACTPFRIYAISPSVFDYTTQLSVTKDDSEDYISSNEYILKRQSKFKHIMTTIDSPSSKESMDRLLENMSKHIAIGNASDISDYIIKTTTNNFEAIDLISRIYISILSAFKDTAKIYLNLCNENNKYNINDQFIEFIIRQKKYSNDTMSLIDKINEEYEKDMINKKLWVFIGTDFMPLE